MTDTTWLSAAAVAVLIKQAKDEIAALDEIDCGIELRTIEGRYKKRIAVRSKGPRQSLGAGPMTPKLWARIRASFANKVVWSLTEWRLPVSQTDPATILGGLELNERHVRAALAMHGVPDLPPPPEPKPPRQRSGGHHMGAHGAVISSLVEYPAVARMIRSPDQRHTAGLARRSKREAGKMLKRPAPRKWTLEEEAELRVLWASGLRGEELASPFDRTAGAVHSRAVLLGINRLR